MRAFLQTSEFTLTSIVNRKRGETHPASLRCVAIQTLGRLGDLIL